MKLPVRCGPSLSLNTGKPVFCKRKGKSSTPEVVMDHISTMEECDDCTVLMKDAEAAFDELDNENEASCVTNEPSPS